MTPVSHGLLPLALAYRWIPKAGARPSIRTSLFVAGFGVLPDVLDPHLALDERLGSWSHTLAAGLGVAVLAVLLAVVGGRRGRSWFDARTASLCVFAYLAHLACDAVSGGVALFRPLLPSVAGGAYLPPLWWIVCDGALLAWAYLVYRWMPLTARLRRAEAAGRAGPGK